MTEPTSKSRLPRTSIMLFFAVVLLIGGGVLMVWVPYHRNQTAIVEVARLGNRTESEIVRPFLIPDVVDDEYLWLFERVYQADLSSNQVADAKLKHLRGLTNLKSLRIASNKVSDAGLKHLQGLTNLQSITLFDTQISDAGLQDLQGLTNLRSLSFYHCQISDAGLEHLQGLTKLEILDLDNTQVTQAGIEKLQKALPDCRIIWTPPTK
ncbi:Internalin-A precursor [Symmachiella dynata]|uniref:leucine-rich repeat domain-containing protein n=1 Tax=Symmachiella dynata TaxID=2527995 RepID=UPI00118AD604|nr:leucine-rich repeat domain-containing protein [Symmachiella dynata]QDT47966.1 Internalin-A precursor [Symmachiella dynata]